jgi:pimeloyl-ACP methyl ester carboxylesterase
MKRTGGAELPSQIHLDYPSWCKRISAPNTAGLIVWWSIFVSTAMSSFLAGRNATRQLIPPIPLAPFFVQTAPHESKDGKARPVPVVPDECVRSLLLLNPATFWFVPDSLKEVRVPILILTGENDRIAPPRKLLSREYSSQDRFGIK